MAVPVKYRHIGDFHEYYAGARKAPCLTLFVGGNHEASNHLFELYYGGWVAPNIYYMGAANVLRLGPLRIAGISGIWKGYHYRTPHFERFPYNSTDVRSIYHVRELDARKLLQLRSQVDVGVSHDWPNGVEWLGNWKWLFKRKDLFEKDAREGHLGNVAAREIMDWLRPPFWFSAHLHIKYAAIVDYAQEGLTGPRGNTEENSDDANLSKAILDSTGGTIRNEEEIDLDMDNDEAKHPDGHQISSEAPHNMDDDDAAAAKEPPATPEPENQTFTSASQSTQQPNMVPDDLRAQLPASFTATKLPSNPKQPDHHGTIENTTTRFLALDKCLPNRDYLQLVEIPPHKDSGATSPYHEQRPYRLTYDPEFLAITRVFAHHLTISSSSAQTPPNLGRAHYAPLIDHELAWVRENITRKEKLVVPENFEITAPAYVQGEKARLKETPRERSNPQTELFCELLEIPNPFALSGEEAEERLKKGPSPDAGGAGRRPRGMFRGGRGGGRGRGRGGGGGAVGETGRW